MNSPARIDSAEPEVTLRLERMPNSSERKQAPTLEEVPREYRLPGYKEQRNYLIDGVKRHWDGPQERVFSPVVLSYPDGERQVEIGSYPLLGQREAMEALHAAQKAYAKGLGPWPQMSMNERCACIEKFADKMLTKREEIVKLIMWEIGKTLEDARSEFDRTIQYVRESIEAVKNMEAQGQQAIVRDGVEAHVYRRPLGVVLCMGPFNYPLNETFTTLIPALLMGNTVIFKPPKLGVLLHEPLMEIFQECFPPGVVNMIYGDGKEVISPIMQSGGIDVFAFIGSSTVADIITRQHPAPHRLTKVLGLGAKNPAIILDDANLEKSLPEIVKGALSYNGQRCTALKNIFVPRHLAERLGQLLSSAIEKRQAGLPWEAGVQDTPLPETGKTDFLGALVDDAVAHGAKILNAGGGTARNNFFTPALLYPVDASMRIFHEEQFGPIVPITPYDDIEEVIGALADSAYGQGISLFGTEEQRMLTLGFRMATLGARINLNTQCQRGPDILPFAARKSSGMGTLSRDDALRVFSVELVVAKKAV